jgi:hypothetical protein
MKKIYAVTFFLMASLPILAQKSWNGGTGSWAVPTNWTPVGVPADNATITFNTGTTFTITNVPTKPLNDITVTGNTQVTLQGVSTIATLTINNSTNDDVTVDAGSTLTIGPNLNMTLGNNAVASIKGTLDIGVNRSFNLGNGQSDVNVTGKIINRGVINTTPSGDINFADGSSYDHARNGGTVPNANWALNSNANMVGITTQAPVNLDQDFGNFTWNSPVQTGNPTLGAEFENVLGNFTVANTGTGTLRLKTSGLIPNTTEVNGSFNLTGGTLVLVSNLGTQNLILKGGFNMSGGELTRSGGILTAGNVLFEGTTEQQFTKTGGVISGNLSFSIEDGAKVDFGTSVLDSDGSFEVKEGARLIVSNADGLRSSGGSGAIQTATRVYNSLADYEFRGPATGVFNTTRFVFGIPTITNPTAVRSLIINNTTNGVVTLSQPFTLVHVNEQGGGYDPSELQLLNGVLLSTPTNFITLGDEATASGVLDPDGDSRPNEYNLTSFVDGPLRKIGDDAFIFPVGKVGSGLHKIGITAPPSGGSNTTAFTAQYFRADPGTLGTTLDAQLQKISGCEYWSLERTGTSAVRVVLSWEANSGCGGQYVSDPLTLTVARFDDATDTWMNEGNTIGLRTGTATAGTITSASTAPGFVGTYGFFALGTTSATANPLPVVFGDVRAFEKNNGVQVDWSNLTETDVAEYNVERSANGRDFSSIATQLPTSNLNDRADYTSFDANPVQGTNYYRIRAIEITGKEVYSKVLAVTIGKDASGLRLYPNPVTDKQVTINLANLKRGAYDLRVVSVSGQDIFRKTIQNQSSNFTQTLNLPSTLKPGVYSMIITADNFRETRTFIVQ